MLLPSLLAKIAFLANTSILLEKSLANHALQGSALQSMVLPIAWIAKLAGSAAIRAVPLARTVQLESTRRQDRRHV